MVITEISIFIFGTIIGSFLNVCIYRIPREFSIISPASHCPSCEKPIRFYDNFPIISYLILRGKCRHCRAAISPRYPMVEGLTGVLALALFLRFGWDWDGLVWFAFTACLLVITFIDLDHYIIPDVLSLPGIVAGFLASLLVLPTGYLSSLGGIAAGGGVLLAVALIYRGITGREGMGGGDVKLLAMIGAFLGWQSVLPVLLVSSFLGSLIGLSLIIVKGKDMKFAVPYGPFLAMGAVVFLFAREEISAVLYGGWLFQVSGAY